MMNGRSRSTGIPKIDADVAKILKMPMRDTKIITQLDEDFPGTKITSNTLQVFVVGAGRAFISTVLGLVAGGAKVVAYEKDRQRGGARSLKGDQYFGFYRSCHEALLMPEFTSRQLERLPNVIKMIADDPLYRALRDKRNNILSMGKEVYTDLPISDKISRAELIEMEQRIIQLLGAAGVLEIIYQEVTIDIITPWLEANKPVFLITGKEINLEIQGLAHLGETPGFVKDFLLGSEDTESLIDAILARQHDLKSEGSVQGMPGSQHDRLPSVAILGGEEAALKCALDLLDRVNPELLRIIYISPEQQSKLPASLIDAQICMMYESLPGYVSEVMLSEDGKLIKSVKLVGYPDGKVRELQASLFIHTHNELPPFGKWAGIFSSARDSITQLLDEKVPGNGLVRDQAIAPNSEIKNILFRITEPWSVSLDDDLKLKAMIQHLVDDDKATIIVSGDNPMIQRVIWFAASLGYRGSFFQVSMPWQKPEEVDLEETLALKRKNHVWQDVNGRLEEAIVEDSKFTLRIHKLNGETLTSLVDYVVNATGKTKKTPLISAMLKNGYIKEDSDGRLLSKHPTLSAHFTIFDEVITGEIDSPSVPFEPYADPRQIEPWGWEEAFEFAKDLYQRSSCQNVDCI